MDLRVFDQGKLWAALQKAGYKERGFRTVRRWIEQGQAPTPEAERVILAIIGVTKEAAPSMTRRLVAGLMALETKFGVSPDELARAQESAAALEAALELDALLGGELGQSQRRTDAPTGDRAGGPVGESPGSKRRSQ